MMATVVGVDGRDQVLSGKGTWFGGTGMGNEDRHTGPSMWCRSRTAPPIPSSSGGWLLASITTRCNLICPSPDQIAPRSNTS